MVNTKCHCVGDMFAVHGFISLAVAIDFFSQKRPRYCAFVMGEKLLFRKRKMTSAKPPPDHGGPGGVVAIAFPKRWPLVTTNREQEVQRHGPPAVFPVAGLVFKPKVVWVPW